MRLLYFKNYTEQATRRPTPPPAQQYDRNNRQLYLVFLLDVSSKNTRYVDKLARTVVRYSSNHIAAYDFQNSKKIESHMQTLGTFPLL